MRKANQDAVSRYGNETGLNLGDTKNQWSVGW